MNENSSAPSRRLLSPDTAPAIPAILSLVIPGSGQFALGERGRGLGILVTIVVAGLLIFWQGTVALIAPLVAMWLWAAWDAYRLARGRIGGMGALLLLAALILYGAGVQATEVRAERILTGWPAVTPYLQALTEPELLEYPTEDLVGSIPFQVPCVDPLPPPDKQPTVDPRVETAVPCAAIGDTIVVRGSGFFPNTETHALWTNPIGDLSRVLQERKPLVFETDDQGQFEISFQVPLAVPLTQLPAEGKTQTHVIRIEQHRPYGSLQPTETLSLVLEKIGETIALAFMATVLGVIFAVPVSFLAARNLMWANPVTRAIYYVVRTTLNVVRSIETLMWAIVFAVWVGLGPFGGMLALLLHTVAALGKLYSEAIESIDPGPIEAVRSTGATFPQVIVYAVLPQIVPTFLSFTLYRWDINVRMSTVIGLISNVGLGFLVIQWIRLGNLRAMATSIIAIVLVVAILDYVSGWLRERVIRGTTTPMRPAVALAVRGIAILGFAALFIWSWDVSNVSFTEFIRGAPDGLGMLRDFAVPAMFERPTEEHAVSEPLPVPCTAGEPAAGQTDVAELDLSVPCGAVGEPLVIQGHDLPANQRISVRWALPDGGYLRIDPDCCVTDGGGNFALETRISPLMEVEEGGEVASVSVVWQEVIGPPQISDAFKSVVDLSIVTLLMALLATTLGSVFAIPLSFFAARNIMGSNPIGRGVYYVTRGIFNLWRSIEPMILALIAAAWVGVGPFAGVLALAINNIPNLGKLFSESIEEIDTGPVEAITATGANRLQTLVYAIAPQLVPKFLAFILYQWDINIRMSTVIGYVGGGGIGQYFRINVQLNQYAEAGMAVWAIVIMVWSMDYLSAKAREALT
ncbi:MAG: phosphonate ABC transporter, permease protein PhnE [Anaerolineae bacterium]|nr:phosphonate ABC transporter, permease protein PhnE [Anaerolineae bacterium]